MKHSYISFFRNAVIGLAVFGLVLGNVPVQAEETVVYRQAATEGSEEVNKNILTLTNLVGSQNATQFSGSVRVSNPTGKGANGLSLQITLDQKPDGTNIERIVTYAYPEEISLQPGEQRDLSFSFDLPASVTDGTAALNARLRNYAGDQVSFVPTFLDLKATSGAATLFFPKSDAVLRLDGAEVEKNDRILVRTGQTAEVSALIKNTGTASMTVTPYLGMWYNERLAGVAPTAEKKYAPVTIAAGSEQRVVLAIPATDKKGPYTAYATILDDKGRAVTSEQAYRFLIGGNSASIVSITNQAIRTKVTRNILPVTLTLRGPGGTDPVDAKVLLTVKGKDQQTIATLEQPVSQLSDELRREVTFDVVLPGNVFATQGDLEVSASLFVDDQLADSRDLTVTVGLPLNVKILTGLIILTVLLVLFLVWLFSRIGRSRVRPIALVVAILAIGGAVFLSNPLGARADDEGFWTGQPFWRSYLAIGGGSAGISQGRCDPGSGGGAGCPEGYVFSNQHIGDYTATPSECQFQVAWEPTEIDAGAPSKLEGPCVATPPPTTGGTHVGTACEVKIEDLEKDPPYTPPKLRMLKGSVDLGGSIDVWSGDNDNDPETPFEIKITNITVAPEYYGVGVPSGDPPGPGEWFHCTVWQGSPLDWGARCEGWQPTIVKISVSFDRLPPQNYSYFYKFAAARDTRDFEIEDCDGNTVACTAVWEYYGHDWCGGPGSTGGGTSQTTDQTTNQGGFSSQISGSQISFVSQVGVSSQISGNQMANQGTTNQAVSQIGSSDQVSNQVTSQFTSQIITSQSTSQISQISQVSQISQTTDQITNQTTDQTTSQTTSQTTDQTTDQTTNQTTDQTTNQTTDQTSNQTTNQTTDQSTNQSSNQSTDQSTNQSTNQSSNQSSNQTTSQGPPPPGWRGFCLAD